MKSESHNWIYCDITFQSSLLYLFSDVSWSYHCSKTTAMTQQFLWATINSSPKSKQWTEDASLNDWTKANPSKWATDCNGSKYLLILCGLNSEDTMTTGIDFMWLSSWRSSTWSSKPEAQKWVKGYECEIIFNYKDIYRKAKKCLNTGLVIYHLSMGMVTDILAFNLEIFHVFK